MTLLKRIGKSSAVQAIAGFLTASYIKFVHLTSRWEYLNAAVPASFIEARKPVIVAAWHGRIFMLACLRPRPKRAYVLVSRHRDGEMIARAMGYYSFETIRGSTEQTDAAQAKGGTAALRDMVRILKGPDYVFITPDGPRGPRQRATMGVVTLAQLTGVPVLPCAYSTRSRRVMGSWDRLIIPRPFTRGVFVWGEPITVPRGTRGDALEAARQQIEDALNAVSAAADVATGHDPGDIRAEADDSLAETTTQP